MPKAFRAGDLHECSDRRATTLHILVQGCGLSGTLANLGQSCPFRSWCYFTPAKFVIWECWPSVAKPYKVLGETGNLKILMWHGKILKVGWNSSEIVLQIKLCGPGTAGKRPFCKFPLDSWEDPFRCHFTSATTSNLTYKMLKITIAFLEYTGLKFLI